MTDQTGSAASGAGRIPEGFDWDWFGEAYPFGIDLMFVRGVEPERVVEALGADPAAARMLSAEAAVETLGNSWVRVGRTGEWAFAMGAASLSMSEYERVGLGLSAGTELALFLAGMELDYFFYFADGATTTSFEPLISAWRDGADPDRFVPQMRQVGLDVDPPADDDESEREPDPTIALLEMLTLALGIRLSRETAMGPLLTARLDKPDSVSAVGPVGEGELPPSQHAPGPARKRRGGGFRAVRQTLLNNPLCPKSRALAQIPGT